MTAKPNYASFGMTVTLSTLLVLPLLGCGNSGPPRAPIAGAVTVGGQPLARGRILFIPQAPTQGESTSGVIVNGKYELDENHGPLIGAHRVEVEADLGIALDDEEAIARLGNRPLPPQPIPPQFNRSSTLVVEVKAEGQNTYDIVVPSGWQTVGRPQY